MDNWRDIGAGAAPQVDPAQVEKLVRQHVEPHVAEAVGAAEGVRAAVEKHEGVLGALGVAVGDVEARVAKLENFPAAVVSIPDYRAELDAIHASMNDVMKLQAAALEAAKKDLKEQIDKVRCVASNQLVAHEQDITALEKKVDEEIGFAHKMIEQCMDGVTAHSAQIAALPKALPTNWQGWLALVVSVLSWLFHAYMLVKG